jgi:competence ComEA-like helix-hairpin-helix protein
MIWMPLTPQERRALAALVGAALVGCLVIGYQRTVGARQTPSLALARSDDVDRWSAAAEMVTPSRPVAVNRATARELTRLPGIGPSLAARIVAERQASGPFQRVEDLGRVRGIGPKTIERLRGQVTVE